MYRDISIVSYKIKALGSQFSGRITSNLLHIADVGSVGIYIIFVDLIVAFTSNTRSTATHIFNLVAAIGDFISMDDNILCFIGRVIGNLQTIVIHNCLTHGN